MKSFCRIGRSLGSLPFGVVLLIALFVLFFWGTLFCARAGLYAGVSRFFDSWFLLVSGVLPFPALKSIAVLLGVNVLCACLFCIPHTLKNGGLLLVHVSVLVLICGSFAGERFRESFAAVGLEGSEVVVDSSEGISFRIVEADSAGCSVLDRHSGEVQRVAWNSPGRVGDYTLYFAESAEIFPGKNAVRFWLKRDPFAIVPYLFSGILALGLLWQFLSRRISK